MKNKFMKRVLAAVLTVATLVASVSATPVPVAASTSASDSSTPAQKAVQKMQCGINIGNFLDAHDRGIGFNNAIQYDWREDVKKMEPTKSTVTKDAFRNIKKQGFTAVRIPVTWYNHAYAQCSVNRLTGEETIDQWYVDDSFMKIVKKTVKNALNAGLYVVLDMHHDFGLDTITPPKYWLTDDSTEYRKYYRDIWKEIATAFKSYSTKLIFESINEPSTGTKTSQDSESNLKYGARLHKMTQDFINVVRKTGGNNTSRVLAIQPYGGYGDPNDVSRLIYGQAHGLAATDNEYGKPLTDPSGDGYIILSVHQYVSDTLVDSLSVNDVNTVGNCIGLSNSHDYATNEWIKGYLGMAHPYEYEPRDAGGWGDCKNQWGWRYAWANSANLNTDTNYKTPAKTQYPVLVTETGPDESTMSEVAKYIKKAKSITNSTAKGYKTGEHKIGTNIGFFLWEDGGIFNYENIYTGKAVKPAAISKFVDACNK